MKLCLFNGSIIDLPFTAQQIAAADDWEFKDALKSKGFL